MGRITGGIIEVATFNMPFVVFVVDSGYHVFVEGTIAGVSSRLRFEEMADAAALMILFRREEAIEHASGTE